MNQLPFVSIIMPVYNDPERVAICIKALQGQTYPLDRYEVLVVDNGSTDHTRSVVQQYDVKLLVEAQKQGSYAARNLGLTQAQGDILAFTDSDCIPASDWIERGVAHLLQTSNCGLVGGSINVFFKNTQRPTSAELYDSVTAFPQKKYVEQEHFGATANVFTYRSVFDRIGNFNDNLKSSGDREWGNRVHAAGYTLLYAEDVRVAHPARHSFSELRDKSVRIITGYRDFNGKKYSGFKMAKHVVWDILPPVTIIKSIWLDMRLPNLLSKARVVGIMMALRFSRAWHRIRIYYQTIVASFS